MSERRDVGNWSARRTLGIRSLSGTRGPSLHMQERNGTDFSDPTCWRYLAEVHGTNIPRSIGLGEPPGTSANTAAGSSFRGTASTSTTSSRSCGRRSHPSATRMTGPSHTGTTATP